MHLITLNILSNKKTKYSGDSVFHVHGNACKTLFNGLETQRFDHV